MSPEADDIGIEVSTGAGLCHHLNTLYGLRPVPDEFMQLVRAVEHRLRTDPKRQR